MDPGRKRFEMREVEYIAVGDTVVTEAGVKFEVSRFDSPAPDSTSLTVVRAAGSEVWTHPDGHLIRCEVKPRLSL